MNEHEYQREISIHKITTAVRAVFTFKRDIIFQDFKKWS